MFQRLSGPSDCVHAWLPTSFVYLPAVRPLFASACHALSLVVGRGCVHASYRCVPFASGHLAAPRRRLSATCPWRPLASVAPLFTSRSPPPYLGIPSSSARLLPIYASLAAFASARLLPALAHPAHLCLAFRLAFLVGDWAEIRCQYFGCSGQGGPTGSQNSPDLPWRNNLTFGQKFE